MLIWIGKRVVIKMENILENNDLFSRLHNGEQVKCPVCGKGIIRQTGNMPIDQEFCFECDKCKAHFRYDPVNVIVE